MLVRNLLSCCALVTSRSNRVSCMSLGMRKTLRDSSTSDTPATTKRGQSPGSFLSTVATSRSTMVSALQLQAVQVAGRHQHEADAGLRIGVDDQHVLAELGRERFGERKHQRGFAHAALGIHHGNRIAHDPPPATSLLRRQPRMWQTLAMLIKHRREPLPTATCPRPSSSWNSYANSEGEASRRCRRRSCRWRSRPACGCRRRASAGSPIRAP